MDWKIIIIFICGLYSLDFIVNTIVPVFNRMLLLSQGRVLLIFIIPVFLYIYLEWDFENFFKDKKFF